MIPIIAPDCDCPDCRVARGPVRWSDSSDDIESNVGLDEFHDLEHSKSCCCPDCRIMSQPTLSMEKLFSGMTKPQRQAMSRAVYQLLDNAYFEAERARRAESAARLELEFARAAEAARQPPPDVFDYPRLPERPLHIVDQSDDTAVRFSLIELD